VTLRFRSGQVKKLPRIFYVSRLPGRYRGITLPPFGIFIEKAHKDNKKLHIHELCHWRQFQEAGLVKTYIRYIWLWFKHGYRNHPLEIECREVARKSTQE